MHHWSVANKNDIGGLAGARHRTWYRVEGALGGGGSGGDAVRTVLIGGGGGNRSTVHGNSRVDRGRVPWQAVGQGVAPALGRHGSRVRMKSSRSAARRDWLETRRSRRKKIERRRSRGGGRDRAVIAVAGSGEGGRNVRTARASNSHNKKNKKNNNYNNNSNTDDGSGNTESVNRHPLKRNTKATTTVGDGRSSSSNNNNDHAHDDVEPGKKGVATSKGADDAVSHGVNRKKQLQTMLQSPRATTTNALTSIPTTSARPNPTTTATPTASTTPTTTTARAPVGYILITDYDQLQPKSFWQKYGCTLVIAAGITLCGATISISIVVIHCARSAAAPSQSPSPSPSPPPPPSSSSAPFAARRKAATRRASVALASPIPLLPEDRTPLHAEPEHPVPMLSVQTAGCAGMERLGVPARTSLNTPPDDRGQFSRRMRVEALQARELLAVRASGETVIRASNNSSSNNHHQHHHHHQHQHQLQHPRVSSSAATAVSGGCNRVSGRSNFGGTDGSAQTSTINSSNIARGGIEATTLKYGNTGSGSDPGSSTGSSCGGHSIASSVNSRSHDHHQHYQQDLQQQQTLRCPHHVPLPDSEWGQDRDLQIRTRYQQSEITRSYIKPPPNKTVKDVPEQSSYNFYSLTAPAATMATATTLHHPSYHNAHSFNQATSSAATSGACSNQQQQQHKSKSNVIMKLWSRKSSPKSPTALGTSSTCSSLASSASLGSMPSATSSACASSSSSSSSVSTSSSASSLSSAQSLPVSTASALTTTACSYGPSGCATPPTGGNNILAGLAPTTQLLTTIGVPPSSSSGANASTTPPLVRIPTPPLSVSVPISYQQQQHKQFQQQLLLDSIVAESATSTAALQTLKSNSCSLATSPLGANAPSDVVPMDCCQHGRAGRHQSLSPSAGRARSSSNELSVATGGVGGVNRNSSNCSMNCCCNNAAGCSCNNCNGTATGSQQQRAHFQDHQHTL